MKTVSWPNFFTLFQSVSVFCSSVFFTRSLSLSLPLSLFTFVQRNCSDQFLSELLWLQNCTCLLFLDSNVIKLPYPFILTERKSWTAKIDLNVSFLVRKETMFTKKKVHRNPTFSDIQGERKRPKSWPFGKRHSWKHANKFWQAKQFSHTHSNHSGDDLFDQFACCLAYGLQHLSVCVCMSNLGVFTFIKCPTAIWN